MMDEYDGLSVMQLIFKGTKNASKYIINARVANNSSTTMSKIMQIKMRILGLGYGMQQKNKSEGEEDN